jgi:hypothetical protein
MGLRLCEVVKNGEAAHSDALAQRACCRRGGRGTMTQSANGFCALPYAQRDRAKALVSDHYCIFVIGLPDLTSESSNDIASSAEAE